MIETTAAPTRRRTGRSNRRVSGGIVFAAMGFIDIGAFGLGARSGDARFGLSQAGASVHLGPLGVPAGPVAIVAGVVSIGLAGLWTAADLGRGGKRAVIASVSALFVIAFLCWAAAGKQMSFVGLLQSTVDRSIPIVLGAIAGCLCERAGVINIAIEGQLLFGAFAGAVVASASHSLWLGVLAAALAGGLLGLILAVFAIRYVVNQIVVGVVLDVFATGLTGYFYDRLLTGKYQNTLNSPGIFGNFRIPVLASIPIVGPVLFDSTVFLYLTYLIVIGVHVGLFRTRWGLRVRAVGEHPRAAETVGIRVLAVRYVNVVIGGLVAGIGGAYLTIGSVGPFGKDVSSGKGYIALAALIFGRWTPIGAVAASLLFGFADALQNILSILGTSIPSDFLLMMPYIVTIIVVAGLVGRVRPPKADGEPYVKS